MPEGYEVIFEGEGDESPDFEPGDVVLRVSSQKRGSGQAGWKRKEANLYWTEVLGVDEALLGFKRNITHLDGKPVEIKKTGTTQPGEFRASALIYLSLTLGLSYIIATPSNIQAMSKL